MNIVFAGTPDFAAAPLRALLAAGLKVTAVYTQPDRPAGRGRKLTPSPVKQVALDAGLPVYQPETLRAPQAQQELAALQPDLLVVIAYGLILPQVVLDIPRLGCVNLHASLLPRWRGAAPIQRAIEAGDAETGICLMQMEAGLDTGPVLASARIPIDGVCTGGELHDALVRLGEIHLAPWLMQLEKGALVPVAQDDTRANYAHKLSKAEARLDWAQPAEVLARQLRAFNPWPVAYAELDDQAVKLWRGYAEPGTAGTPGQILAVDEKGLQVACGQGVLRVQELQLPGGRRMSAEEAARGHALVGQTFRCE